MSEKKKEGTKLEKLSTLSEDVLKNVSLDDLWVMEPQEEAVRVKARYCGCRNVCLV